jgi:hypothetical protein
MVVLAVTPVVLISNVTLPFGVVIVTDVLDIIGLKSNNINNEYNKQNNIQFFLFNCIK